MEANAIINAFTVDVEDYFHVSAYAGVIDREQWSELPSRVARNTDTVTELLAEAGVTGTFFVLGWVAERHPDVVRRIVAAGHEVACHGLSHDLVYRQGRETFREETRRAKALIEDAAGTEVTGYRAASFSITRASLWALDCLAELGFRYDSSIFPVLHDRYGIPDAPRQPFEYRTDAGHSIVEFPMPTIAAGRWRLPVGGGGYFRIYPYAVTRAALRRINRRDRQPFVFYTHPWEVDPGQPTFDAGRLSNFRHRTNLARCHRRLRKLLAEFRFAPMQQVLADLSPGALKSQDIASLQTPAVATELGG
jgi:polysaccharide deacetylase family protein (PEP-CTERM system associated)